jgi:hypothetical protein
VSLRAQDIVELHVDHSPLGRLFPSAFRTQMDLHRWPIASQRAPYPVGKFDTNDLMCQFAALAVSLLCRIGQRGRLGSEAPARHGADRRGVNTVIQPLSYRAARFIEHGPRMIPGLGANDRAATVFTPMTAQVAAAP